MNILAQWIVYDNHRGVAKMGRQLLRRGHTADLDRSRGQILAKQKSPSYRDGL